MVHLNSLELHGHTWAHYTTPHVFTVIKVLKYEDLSDSTSLHSTGPFHHQIRQRNG